MEGCSKTEIIKFQKVGCLHAQFGSGAAFGPGDFKSAMSTYSIIAAYSIPPMEGCEFGGMFWRDVPKQQKLKFKKSADSNHFSN